MDETWNYTQRYELDDVGAFVIEDGEIEFVTLGSRLKPGELRAIVRKLDEIEGKAAPAQTEQKPDNDRDDPDGKYWNQRYLEAAEKLITTDRDAFWEEHSKWKAPWNWRDVAELYERRIAELEAQK